MGDSNNNNPVRAGKGTSQLKLSFSDIHSEFYAYLFKNYPDAVFILDSEGFFIQINDKVTEFTGYSRDELRGTFHNLIKDADLEKVLSHFSLALKGEEQKYQCEVIHKKGYSVQLSITNIPIEINSNIVGIFVFAKNLTIQKQKEAELLKITNSLNLAQEVARLGSWDYDVETNLVYCSDSLFSILGITEKVENAAPYGSLLSMISTEDRDRFDNQFQQAIQTGEKMDIEYRIRKKDNSIITAHVSAVAKRDQHGKVSRIIGILYDISDQIETINQLKESEEKFQNIAHNIDLGIWSMDFDTKQFLFVSPAVEKLTGYNKEDFTSGEIEWTKIIHPDDLNYFLNGNKSLLQGNRLVQQYRIINRNGDTVWVESKKFPIKNSEGKWNRIDGIIQDISERKRKEEEINFFAYHDYLTELPNRRMFDQTLVRLNSECESKQDKIALFYLDLDRFKFVNDTLGHDIGDTLLCEVSKRLCMLIDKEFVFRLGGDEFAIILGDIEKNDPVLFGKKVIREIEKPFRINGYELHITTSIGISIFPDDGDTLKKIKMNTDAALYRAKELGKNNVQLFTKSLNAEPYQRFIFENDLRKAILREEFVLHYQPKINLMSGNIVGGEALIRWNHTNWGIVPPGEFVPLAEETGLIHEMTEWVIGQVCKQLMVWKNEGRHPVPISVNISARTLMKTSLVQKIKRQLEKHSISPSLIEIEITEDALIKNEGLGISTIRSLREMGMAVSIDDFGMGYSSIGYLKKFKADCIKIDRAFIKDIQENNEDSFIVQSIILMAKGLGLKVVAEGVETEQQLQLLKSLNCQYVQGFYFSKPLPAEEFVQWLKESNPT
jgi:diguanylate cyclase (GGDEF)-like protein/PAS domain S-box-containing protein